MVQQVTPYTETVNGDYIVVFPQVVTFGEKNYRFVRWSDNDSTANTRVFTVDYSDYEVTAVYAETVKASFLLEVLLLMLLILAVLFIGGDEV